MTECADGTPEETPHDGDGGPLADRGEGARPGQHRTHRHGEHTGEVMASPATVTRIRQRRQMSQQVRVPFGRDTAGRDPVRGDAGHGRR
jgi:hypothetical protein